MRKIAVFVEGQSEQIFVRSLLERTFDLSILSFECFQLHSDRPQKVPYNIDNPKARVHFMILDVGNDERVLTAVKDRNEGLVKKGYERIIALRDLYSRAYDRQAKGCIDEDVSLRFQEGAKSTISDMKHSSKITIHFAVMELEAWFLAMDSLLKRSFAKITDEFIESTLGFRLSVIDPQTCFYKPSKDLAKLLDGIGVGYSKSRDDVEKICAALTTEDITMATVDNRCKNLSVFYEDLRACCLEV